MSETEDLTEEWDQVYLSCLNRKERQREKGDCGGAHYWLGEYGQDRARDVQWCRSLCTARLTDHALANQCVQHCDLFFFLEFVFMKFEFLSILLLFLFLSLFGSSTKAVITAHAKSPVPLCIKNRPLLETQNPSLPVQQRIFLRKGHSKPLKLM